MRALERADERRCFERVSQTLRSDDQKPHSLHDVLTLACPRTTEDHRKGLPAPSLRGIRRLEKKVLAATTTEADDTFWRRREIKTNTDLQREASERTDPFEYSSNPVWTPRLDLVREMVAGLPSGVLLDVGCFDGAVLAPLAKHHVLHGLDVSPRGLAVAGERGFLTRLGNVEEGLPYGDATFDVVLLGETLEHVIRTDFVLHEANRVLRLGGHLIVTTPNVASPISFALMLFADLPPYMSARYRSGHVRDFTSRTLRRALLNHGFQVRELAGVEGSFPRIARISAPLFRRLPRLASDIVALSLKTGESVFERDKEIEVRTSF